MTFGLFRPAIALALVALVSACAEPQMTTGRVPAEYGALVDGERTIPAVSPAYLNERNRRRWVAYDGPEPVGTIIVDPYARLLYHVAEPGKAMRFGIAVGREGRGFRGDAVVRRKEEYPYWAPTKNMIRQDPDVYGKLAGGLPGGLDNPLGARALYLYRNGKDTMYRIHGTMDPSSIGKATSAGCIRLFNQDIIDMFDETPMGTRVKVRSKAESLAAEGPMVQLHTGYLVSASDVAAIEADQAAFEAGLVADPAEAEAEAHARAVAAARAARSAREAELRGGS
ncbi:L,D-transpeptidase [Phaeovulum sp.]|uniref:L,D-transpeptidase n=1 Tax=Phaeovulum sp. TaxID=2934796 RepID=UPI0039E29D29